MIELAQMKRTQEQDGYMILVQSQDGTVSEKIIKDVDVKDPVEVLGQLVKMVILHVRSDEPLQTAST